jgi:CDP-glucose 4,6-dehydratase
MRPDSDFWAGKRVLLTGHTGFKGSWLALWLQTLGARVTGVALPPPTQPSLFEQAGVGTDIASHIQDIRAAEPLARLVAQAQPEVVFHLAAQPLVRASYREPVETFATNVQGTVHLLEAVRQVDSVRVVQVITTDKVYENREWPWPYRETDRLGGHDPYSASKAAAELAVLGYRNAFLEARGVSVASVRAGNVIGGGDWAEDRLLPDCVRAFADGRPVTLRRPGAVRPWQHVLEPLSGYLRLAQRQWEEPAAFAGAWNFGPDASGEATVGEVAHLAASAWGGAEVVEAPDADAPHEAGRLTLDASLARFRLGWQPRWNVDQAVAATLSWYRAVLREGADARALCLKQLRRYQDSI